MAVNIGCDGFSLQNQKNLMNIPTDAITKKTYYVHLNLFIKKFFKRIELFLVLNALK